MPSIRIRFPGGRYHATPWGQHVNEGAVEWPPSPWRLLRALLAVGFSTEGWEQVPALAERLCLRLASTLPEYWLPPAQLAQTRHYMPLTKLEKGREKTTLVFDTWARLSGDVFIRWQTDLSAEEEQLLGRLIAQLGYLGRAESRIEAAFIADHELPTEPPNVFPVERARPTGPGWEQVSVLAPEPPEQFQRWRDQQAAEATADLPSSGAKQTAKREKELKKEREKALAPFPEHLLDALLKDTAWIQTFGWSLPPGSKRALYWRRANALEVGRPRQLAVSATGQRVEAVLLAITPPSGNFHVLPRDVRALPQAELLHRDLVGWLHREGHPAAAYELVGCDEQRRPLQGHQHSHLLPLDLDGDQKLDHLLVWTPGGLGAEARRALHAVQRTYTKGGAEPLRLAVAMEGPRSLLRTLPEPWRAEALRVLGPSEGALVWESQTPFVLPRFLKARGKNTLEGQVQAELEQRGLPPAEVTVLPREAQAHFRHFVRVRGHGGEPPPSVNGWALSLRFEVPVSGPLCLGYGSHYGLGMFVACPAAGFSA